MLYLKRTISVLAVSLVLQVVFSAPKPVLSTSAVVGKVFQDAALGGLTSRLGEIFVQSFNSSSVRVALPRDFTTSTLPGTYLAGSPETGCSRSVTFSSGASGSTFSSSSISVDGEQCESSSTLAAVSASQLDPKPGSSLAALTQQTDVLAIVNRKDVACGSAKYGQSLTLGIFDEKEVQLSENVSIPANTKVLIYGEIGDTATCKIQVYIGSNSVSPGSGPSSPSPGASPEVAPGPVSPEGSVTPANGTSPSPDGSASNGDADSSSGDSDGSPGGDSDDSSGGGSGGSSGGNDQQPEGTSECFASHSLVELEDGKVMRMDQLKIGDRVRVGPKQFSNIFLFTHRDPNYRGEFVRISTKSGHALTLTEGHYLYKNNLLAPARAVVVGDHLSNGKNRFEVTKVERVKSTGLYNPQTLHGDIVVDGILSSTYTEAVAPTLARALLKPFEALYHLGLVTESRASGLFKCGRSLAFSNDVKRLCPF